MTAPLSPASDGPAALSRAVLEGTRAHCRGGYMQWNTARMAYRCDGCAHVVRMASAPSDGCTNCGRPVPGADEGGASARAPQYCSASCRDEASSGRG